MKVRDIAILIVIATAAFGVFCVALPMLIWKGNVPVEHILEFGQLIVSWPVAVLILALVFLARFRSAIDAYLRNIQSMKLPGGVEVRTQSDSPEPSPKDDALATLTPEEQAELDQAFQQLAQQHELTEAARQQLEHAYNQASSSALAWKFQFLSTYFVQNTKNALTWLHMNPGQTRVSFHTTYTPVIPEESERNAILGALMNYGMVIEVQNILQTTKEATSFLQYWGSIPRV